jgi:hypothetical protein
MTPLELRAAVPIESLLRRYGSTPDARGRWRCLFPERHAHGDEHHSVTVSDGRAHCWSRQCFGPRGADVFDVVGLMEQLPTFPEQRRRIEELAGHSRTRAPRPEEEQVTTYELRDPSGTLIALHERRDLNNGDKTFTWRLPDGTPKLNGLHTADLPLYGAEIEWEEKSLRILVEGEKAAEALWWAGFPALGTVTGANSTPSVESLSVLRGMHVFLWPDNDPPGGPHMERIAERLDGVARSIRIVEWPEAPESGDAADFVALHRTDPALVERVQALLDQATPWRQEAEPAAAGEPRTPTADVLDDVHAFLGRFIAYPSEHARVAHTLWVAHTHLMDAWESTPRLAFLSPEPGSGKTRALEVTETLTPRPVEAVNATPAYLFRKISDPDGLPTILFDEIDTVFGPRAKEHEEIRGVINAGHRRGAMAGRCVVKGKTVTTEELPAFCAVAMAGIGNLPDTILTRSVIVRMRRRAPHEQVEPYRRRLHAPEGHKLRDRLTAWARVVRPRLNLFPAMPDGITDRPADVWESLLCVADAAGSDWPERARAAAVALVADAAGETPSLGVRLLADIRSILEPGSVPDVPDVPLTMGGQGRLDAIPTHELLTCLTTLEEASWGDLRGKPLDARRLANLLKPYGIHSKKIRVGGQTAQGYERADFLDAWARYLPAADPVPSSPIVSGTSGTSGTDPAADLPEGEVEEVELW